MSDDKYYITKNDIDFIRERLESEDSDDLQDADGVLWDVLHHQKIPKEVTEKSDEFRARIEDIIVSVSGSDIPSCFSDKIVDRITNEIIEPLIMGD